VVRFHTVLCIVASATACGSGPSGPRVAPQEPPPPHTAQRVEIDAGLPDAPDLPRLVCDSGTVLTVATAPEPTWHCATPDGTRHGAFITVFPDGSPEIVGSYKDGLLDGAWQRHAVTGEVIETGSYAAGQKTGRWRMRSTAGIVLGEYEMRDGTGVEKRWLDDGSLYSERALRAGVPHGSEKVYAPDATPVITAQWRNGTLDGPRVVGTRDTLRIEETFAAGLRRGSRQIWLFSHPLVDEAYDRNGKLDGAYTIWRNRRVMRARGTFDHGKRDGLWTWNDRDGHKERQGNYLAGKRDGPWTEWYDNKIVFTGAYANGKPHGEFIYYDRNENELGRFQIRRGTGTMLTYWGNRRVASRQRLSQGKPDGRYQELTNRGKVVVEGRYRSAAKDGAWREWTADGVPTLTQSWKGGQLDGVVRKYVDGKLSTESTFKAGRAEGPYTEFRAGKRAVTGQFTDDHRIGTWTHYDVEGRVTLIATYQDGVLHGPWQQLLDGIVLEGTMTQGRRTGPWTQTDKAGAVRQLSYPSP
jgi:antitoxin component YwqK of YwqJK toxin-antitoxin module